jgi:hypothetical protein
VSSVPHNKPEAYEQGRSRFGSCGIFQSGRILRYQGAFNSGQPQDKTGGRRRDAAGYVGLTAFCNTGLISSNPNTIMLVGSAPNFPDGIIVRMIAGSRT